MTEAASGIKGDRGLGPRAGPVTGKYGAERGLTRLSLRDLDLFPHTSS